MKKWLTGLMTALLLTALTLPVMAQEGINARLNQQQARITRAADSGRISQHEQHRLERELSHIRETSQDSHLSHEERHRLRHRMDRLDDDIDRAMHHHQR